MEMDGTTDEDANNPASGKEEEDGQKNQNLSYTDMLKKHLLTVVAYCSVYFCHGLSGAVLGPTIGDLGCKLAEDDKSMSWLFTAQVIAALFGSIISGWLAASRTHANDRKLPHRILLVASIVLPIFTALIPFAQKYWQLIIIMVVLGFKMGVVDNLCNTLMMEIFQEKVMPFLQLLYFTFGVGAFIAPLIAEPFLLEEDCSGAVDQVKNVKTAEVLPITKRIPIDDIAAEDMLHDLQGKIRLRWAFWIMSLVMVPTVIIMIVLIVRDEKRAKKSAEKKVPEEENKEWNFKLFFSRAYNVVADDLQEWRQQRGGASCCFSKGCIVFFLTCTTSLLCLLFDGYQYGFGSYIFTYATASEVHLSTSQAALLNSIFWGVTAIGRLVNLPLAAKLTPAFMFLVQILGTGVLVLLMLLLPASKLTLFVGTSFFAFFMSSTVPTSISFLRRISRLSPCSMTSVVIFSIIGESAFPAILGNLIVDYGAQTLMITGCAVSVAALLLYILEIAVAHQSKDYADRGNFFCLREKTEETTNLIDNMQPSYTEKDMETSLADDGDKTDTER